MAELHTDRPLFQHGLIVVDEGPELALGYRCAGQVELPPDPPALLPDRYLVPPFVRLQGKLAARRTGSHHEDLFSGPRGLRRLIKILPSGPRIDEALHRPAKK